MEAQTDIQTYLEQGKQALTMGQGRESAIAYAHSAQMDPNNPMVHLGLAEANLALGNYGVVQMACRRVQELQPAGGIESKTAQALLDLLDRRYERALQSVDAVITEDPGIAYTHALRAYLLRANGQDYDANLARARAARLSYGGRFENCFPTIEAKGPSGYGGNPAPTATSNANPLPESKPLVEREPAQSQSPHSPLRRQMIRTRFALSQYPFIVTYLLVGINVVVYLITGLLSKSLLQIDADVLFQVGAQNTAYIQATGQYWRIFTAMFLHFDIYHVGINMLSLFFVGRGVEMFYGKWRYLVIYLASGIVGGIVAFITAPLTLSAGASGAIFGIFGAIGVFYLVNRRVLGNAARGAIGNWVFWLILNLYFGFSNSSIGIADHIGGLVAGMLIAYLLIPRSRRGRMML